MGKSQVNTKTDISAFNEGDESLDTNKLSQKIEAVKQTINKKLNQFTDNCTHNPELTEFVTKAYDILLSPDAKRIRGIIPVLIAEAVSMDVEDCILYGVIIELLHFTSLIHDDVIDNDCFRRGYPTLNSTFAKKQAVLIGDYMMVEVVNYCLRSRYSSRVIGHVIEGARNLIAGLIIEQNRMPDNPSMEEYARMVSRKTGSLFGLSFGLPFIADSRMPEAISCGENFGFLFQIYDDFLDRDQDRSYENIFHIMPASKISGVWQDSFSRLLSTSRKIGIETVILDILAYLRSCGYFLDKPIV